MLVTVATAFAGLIGVAIVALGVIAFRAPQAAAGFGIPDTPTEDRTFQAWLSVKAVRDIASGLFVFVLLLAGTPRLVGWFLPAAALIPLGDALIVRRSDGPRTAVYGVHGATAVVMVVIGVLLLVA
ncbi:DUF4267 domain-containing protein [Saccharomonospora sp. NB11]|jgi:hypothetical protein|uniref:DUF4267 domain-containing protein n=1 Tax=Saccharomonospora sp. NB11 TaxID=1642298 RepID=UPI0018D1B30D|nr:DUF4267 domain-containing protein [Saccharomonospora sp. NB11]